MLLTQKPVHWPDLIRAVFNLGFTARETVIWTLFIASLFPVTARYVRASKSLYFTRQCPLYVGSTAKLKERDAPVNVSDFPQVSSLC
jgi:hypothetical protein